MFSTTGTEYLAARVGPGAHQHAMARSAPAVAVPRIGVSALAVQVIGRLAATLASTKGCCLTLRSWGLPPARHLARAPASVSIRCAGQAPSRRQPLSSNVRPHHQMRKFSYWLCFFLVAFPAVLGALAWLLSLASIAVPGANILYLFMSFGSLVPPMLAHVVPRFISVAVWYLLLALVARRVWLQITRREGVPHTYLGTPKVLGYVGAWSFILAAVMLALSIALRAGSGVPAGMLLLPAAFCVPWAFFLTEVLSLRAAMRREA